MALADLSKGFQRIAAALITTAPTRDELCAERDRLLASPPPAPENTLAVLAEPLCRCEQCVARFHEEQATRITHATWAGRIRAIEVGLFQLTYGAPNNDDDETKGRDEAGLALAELCAELLHASDAVRMRPWERVVERDGRGKPRTAWETAPQLGAMLAEIIMLRRRATTEMIFLPTTELTQAIKTTRDRMGAVLVAPGKRPMDPEAAERAGTQPGEVSDAERHGLTPSPGPSVIEGTVRFSRRGRA
jgi:hypothetical protein